MLSNIPAELRALPQWVVSGPNKLPMNPRSGQMADVTDASTWGTFDEAMASAFPNKGFVLTPADPYTIIDLDDKEAKPATPDELERHQKIMDSFDSYTERSVSGRGYHIIIKGQLPNGTGVRRDTIEVYSQSRYMICTGNTVRSRPIVDMQDLLNILTAEMTPAATTTLVEVESTITDSELINMAMGATNAEKFNRLCMGDLSGYPSQSEADFALLSMLGFYTRDNEQVRRLFRMSALGKREKAVRNDKYINFALEKVRAQQPEPVDLTAMTAVAEQVIANAPKCEKTGGQTCGATCTKSCDFHKIESLSLPPGLIGEISQYIYSSAVRPVPEVAMAAALGLVAGICGRSYNISGSGLQQYLILLAKTGAGKEGAATGIDNIIAAIRPIVPMVDQFSGPGAFASGQALVRVLDERPCFVSVLGEFGLTLQQICDPRAPSPLVMFRKVLLDLYSKSGWTKTLKSSAYADNEKNTKSIQAPNVTILGESTPDTLFDGLDSGHIAEGLIPRFSIIEYHGLRPERNKNANQPPPNALIERLVELITVSLTTTNNNTCLPVQIESGALEILDALDILADGKINGSGNEVETQLWNRAHLKALKLSGLLAAGESPHQPIVTSCMAKWAVDFVKREVGSVAKRFTTGNVGQGDGKQGHDLKRVIQMYLESDFKRVSKYLVPEKMFNAKVIPYGYISRKTVNVASFKNDRKGATPALKQSIQNLIDSGEVIEIPPAQMATEYGAKGRGFVVTSGWSKV